MLDMISSIDPDMLWRIGEKLYLHLKKTAGDSVDELFYEIGLTSGETYGEVNAPIGKPAVMDSAVLTERLIAGATSFLPQGEARRLISGWVKELRILALVKTVDNKDARINDILDTIIKYTDVVGNSAKRTNTETWLISELLHRFITNDELVINRVVDDLKISDFKSVLERIMGSDTSRGNIGGKGVYLFGSTNTGDAGMGSDIDLIIHVGQQDSLQQSILENWLDGWSRALAQINYLRTGYMVDRLLDVHIVTDKDIESGDPFATKINSITDPATPLRISE